eukprot:tig00021244_g19591.t1
MMRPCSRLQLQLAALLLLAAGIALALDDEGRQGAWVIQPGEFDARPYGDLAQRTVDGLNQVMRALASFNATTAPAGGKDLRAAVTVMRDYLDIFSFAYPWTPGKPDLWIEVRRALNRGHAVAGAFKDLCDSGVPYTAEEAAQLRAAVLQWKAAVLSKEPAWRGYLARPFRTVLFYRPDAELSVKAWWGACRLVPDLRWTGLQNIARLERASLERADRLMDIAAALPRESLLEEESITAYHNFRKGIRSVLNMANYFPGIFGSEAAGLLGTSRGAYDRLGAIMDKVSTWRWQTGHGQDAREAAADVAAQWDALQAWIAQVALRDVFAGLSQTLIM